LAIAILIVVFPGAVLAEGLDGTLEGEFAGVPGFAGFAEVAGVPETDEDGCD